MADRLKLIDVKTTQEFLDYMELSEKYQNAKSEAIKEFWDKAKQKKQWDVDMPDYILVADGDNLLKEMTEGTK